MNEPEYSSMDKKGSVFCLFDCLFFVLFWVFLFCFVLFFDFIFPVIFLFYFRKNNSHLFEMGKARCEFVNQGYDMISFKRMRTQGYFQEVFH